MLCVEMAINYAEEVLLGGKKKVSKELYEAHSKEFLAVFEKYHDIITRFKK